MVDKGEFRVEKHFFKTRDEITADVAKTGYVHTREFQTPPAANELPLHWHPTGMVSYVLAGSQWFRMPNGSTVMAEPGDRIVIPPGACHAEGHTGPDGGVRAFITKKVKEPLKDTLRMFDPTSVGKPETEWKPIHREVETDRHEAAKLDSPSKL